ncbi:MAG: hypothetical protein CL402_07625 [Acidiferrobacteraceae bacterium]|nr:hypothetical protein [Acidiferrobacteraceae bacterium]|tara:strand:- start:19078 stop:20655 length:1578 start_codon:yes stop_codon:yes gene_type:complete
MVFSLLQRYKSDKPKRIAYPAYTAHPLATGINLGEYTIERVISQTECGYTYAANDGLTVLQEYFPRKIAIRNADQRSIILSDTSNNASYEYGLSNFLLLARTLSQMDQPVRVVHYQEEHSTAWYAIKFTPSASIGDLLRTGKKIPEESLKLILSRSLHYLDSAHRCEILHLDLGPEQILLSGEQELIITGFNVGRFNNLNINNKNTASFFAPEHFHTAGRVGPWSDLYGLGAMLYRGLNSNGIPTARDRLIELQENQRDPLIPASKIGQGFYSKDFLQLIDSMLAISTGDRPKNIDVVLTILRASLQKGASLQNKESNHRSSKSSSDYVDQNMDTDKPHTDPIINNNRSMLSPMQKDDLELMMDALTQIETHRNKNTNVTDALQQAGQILEPADPSHQWARHPNKDDAVTPFLKKRFQKKQSQKLPYKFWLFQKLFIFSRRINPGIHLSLNTVDNKFFQSSPSRRKQKNTLRLFIQNRSRLVVFPFLLILILSILTISVVGIWLDQQTTPSIESTHIEILNFDSK